ncbi:MAG: PQQ-dependent sugar dehydrogenase, partial [Candidatus Eisenbacteria bacterium]|nr:PQQ-dependent sugar dehydrogenase [Candidatus Eisenbacteria bacterium]
RQYRLRVRHRDGTGLWSEFSERFFGTAPGFEIFPLELDDVAANPTPSWSGEGGLMIELPNDPLAGLRLESAAGEPLLEIRGKSGLGNDLTNPPPLAYHVAVRARVDAGAGALPLPRSVLEYTDRNGQERSIYLPSATVPAGATAWFWISANGSSYWGEESQTEPDFSVLAEGAPAPWVAAHPGYRVEVVAGGFQLPVNLAFVPNPGPDPEDPFFYVTELYGNIKVVTRDLRVRDYATGLLNFDPTGDFPGSGEQGLAGIAVDPATGDVYAGMLYDAAPPDGPHYPKVVRFTSTDGGLTAATQTTILDMPGEEQGSSHFIGNLSIGPDGKLYVHMGDGFNPATALNLESFRGKILRMNLDGSAATGNPFF